MARRGYELGLPKPWTDDKVIQLYRFCNVRREDDRVTKWIAANWRPCYPSQHYTGAITLARLLNWPDTLAEIGFPFEFDPNKLKEQLLQRTGRGDKVFNAAYVVTTCGKKMEKTDYVVDLAYAVTKAEVNAKYESLNETFNWLTQIDGLGAGFLAGQIIADLKNTEGHPLAQADDWWTWCAPGPGSKRGLNRLLGLSIDNKWNPAHFRIHVSRLRELIEDELELTLCAQDVQNCLCEVDKYIRALEGGRPKQLYGGRGK